MTSEWQGISIVPSGASVLRHFGRNPVAARVLSMSARIAVPDTVRFELLRQVQSDLPGACEAADWIRMHGAIVEVVSTGQFEEFLVLCDGDDLRSGEFCLYSTTEVIGAEIRRGAKAIIVLVGHLDDARQYLGRLPENVFILPLNCGPRDLTAAHVIERAKRLMLSKRSG